MTSFYAKYLIPEFLYNEKNGEVLSDSCVKIKYRCKFKLSYTKTVAVRIIYNDGKPVNLTGFIHKTNMSENQIRNRTITLVVGREAMVF